MMFVGISVGIEMTFLVINNGSSMREICRKNAENGHETNVVAGNLIKKNR